MPGIYGVSHCFLSEHLWFSGSFNFEISGRSLTQQEIQAEADAFFLPGGVVTGCGLPKRFFILDNSGPTIGK